VKVKRQATISLKQGFRQSLRGGLEMKQAVKLPAGEQKNEWIAMNCIEQFNTLKLVYDFISDYCTEKTCPQMSAASPKGEAIYMWADEQNKKPIEVPAPKYVGMLFAWLTTKFEDESLFPTSGDFPKNFIPEVKLMVKRMFRVYGHIYYKHKDKMRELNAEAHLNTCFKHFYYFVAEFKLLKDKDLEALKISASGVTL